MRYTTYTKEELIAAVAECFSIASVLRKLNVMATGGNYRTVNRKISALGLDTSHFTGQGHLKGKRNPNVPKKPLEEILVENSSYTSSYHLRNRLIAEGVFQRKCSCCNGAYWQGHPMPLELDHKNGNSRDNRKANLRLLCPNCHALTPNYRGKNIGRDGGTRYTQGT